MFHGILLDDIAERSLVSILEGYLSGTMEPGVISPNEQQTNSGFIER
jgi:hypothetical protein